jgi:hypothetical protein
MDITTIARSSAEITRFNKALKEYKNSIDKKSILSRFKIFFEENDYLNSAQFFEDLYHYDISLSEVYAAMAIPVKPGESLKIPVPSKKFFFFFNGGYEKLALKKDMESMVDKETLKSASTIAHGNNLFIFTRPDVTTLSDVTYFIPVVRSLVFYQYKDDEVLISPSAIFDILRNTQMDNPLYLKFDERNTRSPESIQKAS